MTLFRLHMVKQILPSGRIVSWSPWSSWKFLPSLRSCKNFQDALGLQETIYRPREELYYTNIVTPCLCEEKNTASNVFHIKCVQNTPVVVIRGFPPVTKVRTSPSSPICCVDCFGQEWLTRWVEWGRVRLTCILASFQRDCRANAVKRPVRW